MQRVALAIEHTREERKQGENKDERSRERKHRNKFACLCPALFCVLSTLIQVREEKRSTCRQTQQRHSMTNKSSTMYTETKRVPVPALVDQGDMCVQRFRVCICVCVCVYQCRSRNIGHRSTRSTLVLRFLTRPFRIKCTFWYFSSLNPVSCLALWSLDCNQFHQKCISGGILFLSHSSSVGIK